jgi:aspartate/methionine/tyrosine aminotransferase
MSEEEWTLELLARDGVIVHPGHFFDLEEEAYLVLSLLPREDELLAGVQRIVARVAAETAR